MVRHRCGLQGGERGQWCGPAVMVALAHVSGVLALAAASMGEEGCLVWVLQIFACSSDGRDLVVWFGQLQMFLAFWRLDAGMG